MDANGIFGSTLTIMERALDLRSRRHTVLSTNVVNQDTPYYTAFDVAMEAELDRIGSADAGTGRLAATHPQHLSDTGGLASERHYQLKELHPALAKRDGNTVDIDRTMADMAENTLMYNALTRIVTKRLNALKSAIKGGSGA